MLTASKKRIELAIPPHRPRRRRQYSARVYLGLALCAALSGAAYAQTNTGVDGFIPTSVSPGAPTTAYALTDLFSLNYYTGNLSVHIPLHSISGRGGDATFPIDWVMDYARAIQDVYGYSGWCTNSGTQCHTYYPVGVLSQSTCWASLLSFPPLPCFQVTSANNVILGSASNAYSVTRINFYKEDGTSVELVDANYYGEPVLTTCNLYNGLWSSGCNNMPDRGSIFVSHDGSQLVFQCNNDIKDDITATPVCSGGTLRFPSGTKYIFNGQVLSSIEDRNGNQISMGTNAITDSLGRVTQFATSSYNSGNNATTTVSYPGAAGTSRQITIQSSQLSQGNLAASYTIQPYNSLFGALYNALQPYAGAASYDPLVCSSITLADNTSKYTFHYNSYGEVARIDLPTGGAYEFTWDAVNGFSQGVNLPMLQINRGVTEVREYPNGTALARREHITYNQAGTSGGTTSTTSVEYDGSGNVLRTTTHWFYYLPPTTRDPLNHNAWADGLEYETDIYSPGGSLAKKTTHTWQQQGALPWGDTGNPYYSTGLGQQAYNPRDAEIDTTNDSGQVSAVKYLYDQYNNVTDEQDLDWGNGSPAGLLRHKVDTYVTSPQYVQVGTNLVSLPFTTSISDGNGNQQSYTLHWYDEYQYRPLQDDPGIVGHDAAYNTGYTPRGNLTTIWESQDGSNNLNIIGAQYTYDIAGNVVAQYDGKGNLTQAFYSNDCGTMYGKPTSVVDALQETTNLSYDCGSRGLVSATDANNVSTTYSYNDPLDRLTLINRGAGTTAETHTAYSYPNSTTVVTNSDQITPGDGALKTQKLYDGFGREIETDTFESGSQYIASTKTYDALGRLATVTNPSRPGDGLNYATTYSYDALNRVLQVTTPDGSATNTSYSGNNATVVDPGGITRTTSTDALGRLTFVAEDPNGLNYVTGYYYDALNDLTMVSQGACGNCQQRHFTYDGLKRLTSATNPETGTISYSYDPNGNLTWKQDNRGVQTWLGYDPLNRLTTKTYSDGTRPVTYTYATPQAPQPNVQYSMGRLVQVSNYWAINNISGYDPLGRISGYNEQTAGQTYPFAYTYNLAGSVTAETYPSGRVVSTVYDGANRPYGVSGVLGGAHTNYVSISPCTLGVSIPSCYWPNGEVYKQQYGNSLVRTNLLNSRLQLSNHWDAIYDSPSYFLAWDQYNWGTTNNNGNLQGHTGYVGGPGGLSALQQFTQTYGYDGANRLTSSSDVSNSACGGTCWYRNYQYDQYGNMWVTASGGLAWAGNTPGANNYNPANNQRGDLVYDAAGNELIVNGNTASYDAENRMVSNGAVGQQPETYVYDGDGHRVQKIGPDGGLTAYVYNASGGLTAEYSTDGPSPPPCNTCYYSYDHLGSVRMITDQNANVISRHDYIPFGEEISPPYAGRTTALGFSAADNVTQRFTGKERDSESGLDYFGARYYGSALGRFTSPDEFKGGFDNLDGQPAFSPGPIGYADLSDPQTLNMYVYTRNNPLRFIDPDGHDFWDYLSGVGNAFVSDNALGAGRSSGGNQDFRLGQVVGDAVATITGSIEALGGGGEAVVTSPAALTGVGALAPAAGVAVAAHGAATAAVAGGHLVAAAASKVDDIAGQIEQGGYQVTQNPKTPNQEGNVTISHPDQPGTRVNVRVETHPIPGSGGRPVRHANVEVVKPGPKNRPRVVSNEHIDQ